MDQVIKLPESQENTQRLELRRRFSRVMAVLFNKPSSFGRVPEILFLISLGLLAVALSFINSSSGAAWVEWLYWTGLFLIVAPVAYRLYSVSVGRQERIVLVLFLGLFFYLIKLMHSPYLFTFSDELLHYRNAENILATNALFGQNIIHPTSPYYPGLEIVTTALASLGGLSLFSSGVILIGVARLITVLALFLLVEQVSHSSRVASLGVLLYMANSNALYFSAQFSYESLALPLALLALFALIHQTGNPEKRLKIGISSIIVLLIAAIVVTHHMTSYALTSFLALLVVLAYLWQIRTRQKHVSHWVFALIAGGLSLAWLILVAHPTATYLYQIFSQAFTSVIRLFTGQGSGRVLFTPAGGPPAPLWQRVVGISSAVLISSGILSGLYFLWKRQRFNPFTMALAIVADLYFITLGMRLSGAAWEIANRSSEFLFIGVGFLIAFSIVSLQLNFPQKRFIRFLFGGYVVLIIFGGVIAGWPPALRLAQPIRISLHGTVIQPQGLEVSDWLLETHGPNNQVIGPTSDAMLMLSYGQQQALTGKVMGIQELLTTPHEFNWQTDILQALHTHYLIVDRRKISWDGMQGIYFTVKNTASNDGAANFPDSLFTMFDTRPQADRIFDSGDIIIYDVGGISGVTPAK